MKRRATVAVILGLLASQQVHAQAPAGWRGGPGWEVGVDREVRHGGRSSGYINVADLRAAEGFGTLRQSFLTDEYRGKRVRFSAWVKTDAVEERTALWMRVDGEGNQILSFDNMSNRPIGSRTDWRRYEIVLDVPPPSISMIFGLMVIGKGRAWIDDAQLDIVGPDVSTTGLSPEELAELAAAAADHGHTPEEIEQSKKEAAERLRTLPKHPLNLDFES